MTEEDDHMRADDDGMTPREELNGTTAVEDDQQATCVSPGVYCLR
jgi:hypothetical protein